MPLTAYRGSTQDGAAGVQVATAVNESGAASGALTAGVQVGNKSTYPSIATTGITTAYAYAGGDVTTTGFAVSGLYDLANCLNVNTQADSSVASANLTGRLIFYNDVSGCIGISTALSFVSDPTLRLGNAAGNFICPSYMTDVQSARYTNFFVDSISAGIWTVRLRGV